MFTPNEGFTAVSEVVAAFNPPHASPLPAPGREVGTGLRAWGFWGSLGWGVFAAATGVFAAVVYAAIWMLTHQFHSPSPEDPAFAIVAGIVGSVMPLAVLAIAAKARRFSLSDYFALNRVSRHDLIPGIACLTVLIVVGGAMGSLFGIDGSKSFEAIYRAARLGGILPMLWLATIVVAPVAEELLFRGFLHRGWAASWLGASGTIVLTAALWAALHQQYPWLIIVYIFLMGLIFGWARQRSGSTMLTIMLHALNNLFVMIVVAVQIDWLS